jgi:hypothetical protein
MACTDQYSIAVEPVSVSGNNNVGISSPHIIQYPKPPKRDDGKWSAIGGVLGSLIGRLANSGRLSQAGDAEDKWKVINGELAARGTSEWTFADAERAKADTIDNQLGVHGSLEWDWAVYERNRALQLETCLDALHTRLCAYALCGYRADYRGILDRVRAESQIQLSAKLRDIREAANRYNTGINADVACDLERSAMLATVGTAMKLMEDERQFMWKINNELVFKAANTIETHRVGRMNDAQQWEQSGNNVQAHRYQAHDNNDYRHVQLGGQFKTGAGQNYAWLAESLRRTAQLDGQDFATLGALLALFLPQFFDKCAFSTPENCGCCDPATIGGNSTKASCEGAGGKWTPSPIDPDTGAPTGADTCTCA